MTHADVTEFAEFYSTHFHRIAGQLYAYLGDHAEAQDITQEAFCRALDRWRKVSTYAHAPAWVRQVAWNLATSRLRHLQVTMRHLARQRIEHVDGPGPDRVALTRALATLPPNHRLAVVLHHLGYLTVAEIAEQQGVAEGTVRSWLSRGRSQLAEYFVEKQEPQWKAITASTFQPDGVEAAASTVKRRRTARRSALAVALVLALAIPVAILLRERGDKPPVIGPTTPPSVPSVSPSPLPTRTVALEGVEFNSRPRLSFVDSQHVWVHHSSCEVAPPPPGCGHTLGVSGDGGKTWRRVPLPSFAPDATVVLYPHGPDTLTLFVLEPSHGPVDDTLRYLFTNDRGATFNWYPEKAPPVPGQLANRGAYQLLCPGAKGFEDGARSVECEQTELIKIGEGRVSPQPPIRTRTADVLNGADGRLWILDQDRDDNGTLRGALRLLLSTDGAKTWREMPSPPKNTEGYTSRLSPDGKELWLESNQRLLRLVGDQWQTQPGTPAATVDSWVPVGDGAVAVTYGQTLAFISNGVLNVVPEIPGGYLSILADGTLVIYQPDGYVIGAGTGTSREWTHLRH